MSHRVAFAALFATACHAGGPAATVALHAACPPDAYWDRGRCAPRGDGAARVAAGKAALEKQDLDEANAALAAAEQAGPLDHATNVTLWEQRGIAAAYADNEANARVDFSMMLALDPAHFLSYTLAPKATFLFEKVRTEPHASPALEVIWDRGQRLGAPIPLRIDVLADPRSFLQGATLYVRPLGTTTWRATELGLGAAGAKVVLPAVAGTRGTGLELYLRAYNARHDEVLAWGDPVNPRVLPLRYDRPTPWYGTWWVITIAAVVVAAGTGAIVYETTLAPPSKAGGGVTIE